MSNLLPRIEFGLQALVSRQSVCPFCRGNNHAVVARKHGVVRIRRCGACSLYFTDPIYKSHISDLYGSLYDAEGSTTTVPAKPELDALKATCFAGSDKDCAAQISALARLGAGHRLLEIGSSWGYFLYQAQTAGYAVVGVEPGTMRREYGERELRVDIRGAIEAVTERDFDIIYSAHTLEHFTEPDRFFPSCYERLRVGGLLVIEVPHFDLELLGSSVLSIIGAVHPLGLSRSFFENAVPRSGFRLHGIFEDWASVPSHPAASPRAGNLIVVAEKMSPAE